MNIGEIKYCDISSGTGCRVTVFVSGCRRHCQSCHNPETWDFNYGSPMTDIMLSDILLYMNHSYIEGLTLCGGEPFEDENIEGCVKICKSVRERYGNHKTIWCYTGHYLSNLIEMAKDDSRFNKARRELLEMIDVLVDGPYVETRRDPMLKFRGSSNQNIYFLDCGSFECFNEFKEDEDDLR